MDWKAKKFILGGVATYILLGSFMLFLYHGIRPWPKYLSVEILTVILCAYYAGQSKKFLANGTALALCLGSPLFIYALSGETLGRREFLDTLGMTMAVSFGSLFLLYVWKTKLLSVVFGFAWIILLFPILLYWGYYFSATEPLNAAAVLAIFQTNPAEAISYLREYFSITGGVIIVLIFSGGIWFIKKILASENTMACPYRWMTILLALLCIISGFHFCRAYNLYHVLGREVVDGLENYHRFAAAREKRKSFTSTLNLFAQAKHPGVYVLVIGESQNRNHMSAYGYEKETTPWLDSMRQDPHMIFFENARSCHTHTVQVLLYALTSKNQYNEIPMEKAITILESVKAAGFSTAWLSNQVQYGAWDTPTTVIAAEAEQQRWLNQNLGETTSTNHYDGDLVDSLKDITVSDSQLIVIHLMGNHGAYQDRYPSDFAIDAETLVGTYDNSIRYNDAVVRDIYEAAKTLPYFQGLIYMADHADDVDREIGHDSSRFTQDMTKIPFYMIFSDEYLSSAKEEVKNLRAHRSDMFTNDLLYNTVLGIMGIRISETFEPQNDLTCAKYDADEERFRTLYGKKTLER